MEGEKTFKACLLSSLAMQIVDLPSVWRVFLILLLFLLIFAVDILSAAAQDLFSASQLSSQSCH